PLPCRGGLQDRHCGRGHAAAGGRRPADRAARRRDARDPEGVPRDGARSERALVALARVRHERAGSRAGLTEAVREIPLARPWLDEREEGLVLEVLRSGRLSLGPWIDRFEREGAEGVVAPYAAGVSGGMAG